MKLKSFRLRIALLSALLAGTAIVGLGCLSLLLIYKAKVTRLDSEIKAQLQQESLRKHPLDHWQDLYEKLLPARLGISDHSLIALLVTDPPGNILYRSKNWLFNIDLSTLWPPPSDIFPPAEEDRRPPLPPPPPEVGLPPPPPPPGFPPEIPPDDPGKPPFHPIKWTTHRSLTKVWRIGATLSPHTHIAIAVNLQIIHQEMSTIASVFLISIPVSLLLIALGAWWVSGRALKPLQEVTRTIQGVTAQGLEKRLSITEVDGEFIELLQVFNQMMERLERSFKQASRFSADAAHELKTPLAILQGELERTLQQAEVGSELQQNLSNLLDEVRRLSTILRKLLLLSLADAGQMRLQMVTVDLSAILTDLADDLELLAPHLDFKIDIPSPLKVKGDRDLLMQVLQNLVMNAIKYNVSSGWIKIKGKQQQKTVLITVINCSKNISSKDRERIFDRFYRGDPSRTHQIEGLGLGLSLSREIARSHGGDLTLDPSPVGQTAFTLKLPTHL